MKCESHSVMSDSLQSHGLYTVHGILQPRIPDWVAIPFSRRFSQPRHWTLVSCIAGRFFTSWATREASRVIKLRPIYVEAEGWLPWKRGRRDGELLKWAQIFSLEEKILAIDGSAHYNGVNVFMPMNSWNVKIINMVNTMSCMFYHNKIF